MDRIPTALIILDGYGLGPPEPGNAIWSAKTPELDRLITENPHTILSASEEDVGLPSGQMGNSEVGHTNIGAGRVVFQDLPRISKAISDGSFFENKAYVAAMNACRSGGNSLHLMGLLSDGGVHSHNSHLYALLEMAKARGLAKVYVHAFLDGRDMGPTTGLDYVRDCVEACNRIGVGKIATVMGRYYGMDRDRRWERVELAYAAMVYGEGETEPDPVQAVKNSYDRGVTDEFVKPVLCDPVGIIKPNDSVIFFNFRPDRAREITGALTDPDFDGFERKTGCLPLHFVCTTQYDETMKGVSVAFPPEEIRGTLGEYVSRLGLKQLRIAETEKYAHVTFFFNGGDEKVFPGEDRVLIPSPKQYPTYDLIPEMSAYAVAEEAVKRIESGKYDLIVLNFANCDMVGHTGVREAAIKAVEAVDECVGRVVRAVSEKGGISLITSDHGNADRMYDATGNPDTAHTTNPVPLIIVGADVQLKPGRLADLAPTILDLMGLEKPPEMTGESLIVRTA
ncbi:MAG: 2,3-bisphosphoglycerate-independent phosphoglycerate mutase [Oscillospiraceae bacterium]|jgi:2,3-bisphosphoglycerate-independent phosphoglycerate mutase